MDMRINTILISAAIGLAMISCNKDETPTPDGLMSNGSFENGGSFSTDGWSVSNGASDSDVPDGGGSFSLKLNPASLPGEGYADYIIEDLEGSHTFNASCFMRSFDDWPGSITLKKRTADNVVTILATAASSDAGWIEKTISASATFNSGDVLIIHLSAGSTEIPIDSKYVLFDLVTIEE